MGNSSSRTENYKQPKLSSQRKKNITQSTLARGLQTPGKYGNRNSEGVLLSTGGFLNYPEAFHAPSPRGQHGHPVHPVHPVHPNAQGTGLGNSRYIVMGSAGCPEGHASGNGYERYEAQKHGLCSSVGVLC